jgi:hypothetical protein
LKSFGVDVIVGSHSDANLVEPLAEEADVVIAAADVDDLDAANAILVGMRRKYEKTGKPSTLIHTVSLVIISPYRSTLKTVLFSFWIRPISVWNR